MLETGVGKKYNKEAIMSDEKYIKTEGLVRTEKLENLGRDVWDVFIVDDPLPFPIGKILLDNGEYKYYEGGELRPWVKRKNCDIRETRWVSLMSKINQRL